LGTGDGELVKPMERVRKGVLASGDVLACNLS
jgi:hypothetical protein